MELFADNIVKELELEPPKKEEDKPKFLSEFFSKQDNADAGQLREQFEALSPIEQD